MNFLKTAALNGLYILLPLVLIWFALKELVELLGGVAVSVTDMIPFPAGIADDLPGASIMALLLIVTASLVIGIAAKISWVSDAGHSIERSVFDRIPGYRMIKLLSGSLIKTESGGVVPALLKDGSGGGDPCYVIEKHSDGRATVLLPWSPASFSGSLKVVQQSDLEILSCSLDQYSRSLSQMGVGLEECVARNR